MLILLSLIMIPSILVSLYFGELQTVKSMTIIAFLCFIVGIILFYKSRRKSIRSTTRDGYLITFITWLILVILSAMPFYLSGNGFKLIDCIFESSAGWSTTGAFVIAADSLPKGLLFWKAVCNWFGGIGIIMLIVSITPYFSVSGQKLSTAEAPGPNLEKMSAKFHGTARYLYSFYIVLTLTELCLLKLGGLTFFDATINSLSCVSTSGIHLNSGGITSNLTTYIKVIITLFSFLCAINFAIYFYTLRKRFKDIFLDLELRVFIFIILISTLIIGLAITYTSQGNLFDALSMSVSFFTTSGFAFTEYSMWPTVSKIILISAMFIGGCAVSTSGGIKVSRIIVFYKLILRGIYKRIHPRGIKPVLFFKKTISVNNVFTITVYVLLYFLIFIVGSLLLSLDNLSIETTLSGAIGAMSNVGLSFGKLANVADYSIFSLPARLLLSMLMIGGRLEFYAIVLLFTRPFWNTNTSK